MTKVLVLLSTWNGARYLPEQIDSLFAQQFEGDLAILIRDDGSSDGTVDYIYNLGDSRIRLIRGKNLGPRASFFELLRIARDEKADFFALCDQDDVWHPRKIARALSLLDDEFPSLYSSSLDLVDEDLSFMRTYVHPGNRSFVSTLVSNFVTGCTCVFNRSFLERMPLPENAAETIMHDWWLASVATLGQQIVYDSRSFVAYRQHGSNHVGIKTGVAGTYLKLRKALGGKSAVNRFDHARQFLTSAGDLFNEEQRKIVTEFLSGQTSWLRRLRFAYRHRADIGIRAALRSIVFP